MVVRVHVQLVKRVALVLLTFASLARAEDRGAPGASAIGRGSISDDLVAYYDSERVTGFLFGGLGVASTVAGGVLVTRSTDFERGLGWSLVSLGVLEILGGGFYALQVGGEIRHYRQSLASDAGAFKLEEGEHIEGTISRFPIYRISELVVAAAGIGVATYGFASKHEAWGGAGVGVASEALSLFALDAFGQARARAYDRRIRRFDPMMALSVGGGERPWGIGVGGRF
jgi:hypothetical protein